MGRMTDYRNQTTPKSLICLIGPISPIGRTIPPFPANHDDVVKSDGIYLSLPSGRYVIVFAHVAFLAAVNVPRTICSLFPNAN